MNKTNLIVTLTVATAFVAIIGSCKKDKGKEPEATTTTTGTTGTPTTNGCDTVTYTKHIKPITDGNCAISGCHTGGNSNPLLMTYDDVKKQAAAGRIKARVIDESPSRMPPEPQPALSAAQKALINCWLANGHKQ